MKISPPRTSSYSALPIALGISLSMGAGAGIAKAESTYQPWAASNQAEASQTSDQKLQNLVTELNALIKKAQGANAADPNFLADLKKLAAQYSLTPALGGPGTIFLSDNFADGDYTTNPTWKVSAGTWKVDVKGARTGLYSTLQQSSSNKITGNEVLKAILGVQQQQAPQSTFASIYTSVPIANTFKLTMKIVSGDRGGPLNIGPYQGASASSGYRLVYQPGNNTGLLLQRIVGNQVALVGSYNDPVDLETGGKVHELTWSRDANGKMRVYVDGQQLIIATDTQIKGNFDGWLKVNQGGSYWIREIRVEGI